jgi:hypothetical protein
MKTHRVFGGPYLAGILAVAVSATPILAGVRTGQANIEWFWHALKHADTVRVYEGLPHPVCEPDSHTSERTRAAHFTIAGEYLYQKPIALDPDVLSALLQRFHDRMAFVTPNASGTVAMKFCGGFHADYAIAWESKGTRTATALLCFGCGEVRLAGPAATLTTDFVPGAADFFRRELRRFRQQRPAWSPKETPLIAQLTEPSPALTQPISLPNDVAQKTVRDWAREPLAQQSVDFWWLERLLRTKNPAAASH